MRAPFSYLHPIGSARPGRRAVLRLLVALPAAAALTAGCAGGEEAPDPLRALADAARADAELARGVANAHQDLRAGAEAVERIRTEHARLLQREVDRLDPPDPDQQRRRPPAAQVPAAPEEAKAALRRSLAAAEQDAAKLCPGLPGYRSGLTGSISASCASLAEVLA
ncbi:hypothetical protein ACL03H_16210 [Saccharopolyspora sp. MS10]|uniref:hypothetical protein n=1 Tax=Saccharopolyspora sp. MS10 TaxID=3385973 RepID=UPI0039A25DC1